MDRDDDLAKPWSKVASARRESFHHRLGEVKKWREERHIAGKPSALEDFFRAHGLCFECQSTGTNLRPVASMEATLLYVSCPNCGGTGKRDQDATSESGLLN